MFVNKNIPRISTRGRFDLLNGKPIAGRSPYTLYPARSFDTIYGSTEVTIMIHGLRNNPASAVEKFNIAKRRLVKLGYKHPLVGFTYDSHLKIFLMLQHHYQKPYFLVNILAFRMVVFIFHF